MEAMRQSWSDDRLDALNGRVDEGFHRVDDQFKRVDEQFKRVDEQFKDLRAEMTQGFNQLNERFDRLLLGLLAIGGGVIAALLAGLVAVLVASG